ncbi:hypothetical protein, partial [Dialister hominis]|uniref:hypothetical protein n=1 Tax=Dialister hominis TaxID=2582419 RepID=UPI003AAB5970
SRSKVKGILPSVGGSSAMRNKRNQFLFVLNLYSFVRGNQPYPPSGHLPRLGRQVRVLTDFVTALFLWKTYRKFSKIFQRNASSLLHFI